VVLVAIACGAISKLAAVWELADVAMGLMAIVNLVAICFLSRWALAALSDFHH
jgi:AGCS family alanine or glycine:cation symporter